MTPGTDVRTDRPITVAFLGDESLAIECARLARSAGAVVAGVCSRSEAIRQQAAADGFDVLAEADLAAGLGERSVDVLFSIANERLMDDGLLSSVPLAVNFHDGPLPGYRGLAVTTWAILRGETTHAITWHVITTDVDAGDVIETSTFDVLPDETAFSLNARCYDEGLRTFPTVLARLMEQRNDFAAQPAGDGELFGRYRRPLVLVDPALPAATTDRAVRALDLGPRVRNRLGAVRWVHRDGAWLVGGTQVVPSSGQPVGTVTADEHGIRLSTPVDDLLITSVSTVTGVPREGDALGPVASHPPVADAGLAGALETHDPHLARHETFWVERLERFVDSRPAHINLDAQHSWETAPVAWPDEVTANEAIALALTWWCRTSGGSTAWFEWSTAAVEQSVSQLAPLVARPLGRFDLADGYDLAAASAEVHHELTELSRRGPFLIDLVARHPPIRGRQIQPSLRLVRGAAGPDARGDHVVELVVDEDARHLQFRARADAPSVHVAAEQVAALLSAARHHPSTPLVALDLLSAVERGSLAEWNATERAFDHDATIDAEFMAQVVRTPHAAAVSSGAITLTYAELAARVDSFARVLSGNGATSGSLVGVALDRDVDLLVSILAVLQVGAAYVPLDPEYPKDRLRYMVADSQLRVLVATRSVAAELNAPDVVVVHPRDVEASPSVERHPSHTSADLAYVIYTSGSTGHPKGVMLEHRNVINFFVAMDEVIDHDPPGTWLAVTSLSFDISVLELLWTVTRGFHVVIQRHGIADAAPAATAPATSTSTSTATTLSLFFFAASDEQASDGYRLLRESAVYADKAGFEAVWLPERHFHEFGGAYPNPSVLAAAVAALTTNVGIRAGSVVLPLHASPRVAEEWAVVDNLSAGRVGISFAPGWQPNDFVLNPGGYATAREGLERQIDEVRALWRGESVTMAGPNDSVVDVRTLPRPIQPELPVWLTSAGTTATFERAGRLGLNLLTHLLGQSLEQLGANIAVYRAAWREHGHAGSGHVTVMMHTYLCGDRATARRVAEEPMKRYLGTATGLLKDMASAFPTFANAGVSADEAFRSLTPTEMDELLTVAAERYLTTSGMFGTVDDAMEMASALARQGADEVACLIDFGIDTDQVLASLPLLGELRQQLAEQPSTAGESTDVESETFAELVGRHGVTHIQCTPSLAAMLTVEHSSRDALGSVRHLMVGGEALPQALAVELRSVVAGRLTNMYGPTETTIWSLTHEVDGVPVGPVPIGRPIANTTLHILDPGGHPVPVGVFGELHIGGDGVARGYLHREELTASRFVERGELGRVYATGDLARFRRDGVVEFAGRVDFQVKIRGHRIELGEIETRLDSHPSVERSVVVAQGEGTDARLVAFVVAAVGGSVDANLLQRYVAEVLPDVMVPDLVVGVEAFPLTPNGKVDRGALPRVSAGSMPGRPTPAAEAPSSDTEQLVADVWAKHLGRPAGRSDNFFEIGGHSLLAVAVFRELQVSTGLTMSLTDVFRYPTIASFASYVQRLQGGSTADASPGGDARLAGSDRGARRRMMRGAQRGGAASDERHGTGVEA